MSPAALAAIIAGFAPSAEGVPARPLAARLLRPTALLARPGGRRLARLRRVTEFDSPTTLAVAERSGEWLRVRAAQLPNGRTGWIRARHARLLSEPRTIVVDLSRRELSVRKDGRVTSRHRIGIGAAGTPTPAGQFFVTDRLTTRGASPYGCCILALNGHQPNLPQGWGGGDRLAIHGTTSPASIGQARSSGCVRASNRTMKALMRSIPLGAPVTIRR